MIEPLKQHLRLLEKMNAILQPVDSTQDPQSTIAYMPADCTAASIPPGYVLESQLGRGGMGVVYRARHVALGRTVAVKMILAGTHAGPSEVARFRTEAEATAQLQHPNIVQIHEIGIHDGVPYFTLEFCGGGSLHGRLAGAPIAPIPSATLTATLADAVQFAHDRRILHRDLKPSNILLQPNDSSSLAAPAVGLSDETLVGKSFDPSRWRVKIADFGLAKNIDAPGQTETGAVVGTPSYMAPEQAAGLTSTVGPAVDIYALGAILYELLTGRPPFRAATMAETISQVCLNEPMPPSRLNSAVPRDLETICLKCLEKDPLRRYATAADLAADLRRFERGEPISARPIGTAHRAYRWCRRNPRVAGLTAAIAASLILGTAIASYLANWGLGEAWRADQAAAAAKKSEAEARTSEEQSKRSETKTRKTLDKLLESEKIVYAANIALADKAWKGGDPTTARQLLAQCREEMRGWEYDYLHHHFEAGQRALQHPSRQMLALSGDGRRIVVTGLGGTHVLDADTEERIVTLQGAPDLSGRLNSAAISNDGRRIVGGGKDRLLHVWEATTGIELFRLTGHDNDIIRVAISADGKWAVSGSVDKTVRIWDLDKGQQIRSLTGHRGSVLCVALREDAGLIVSGDTAGKLILWDPDTGERVRTTDENGAVLHVQMTSDGSRIAIASGSNVTIRDVAEGSLIRTLSGHKNEVYCVALSRDCRRIASCSEDRTIKLWDMSSGAELATLKGHAEGVLRVAMNDAGTRIASSGMDKTLRIWDVEAAQTKPIGNATVQVHSVDVSSDGNWIAAPAAGNTVQIWPRSGRGTPKVLRGHMGTVRKVEFSEDGKRIVSLGNDRTVRIWDTATATETLKIDTGGPISHFVKQGSQVATLSALGEITYWDANDGTMRKQVKTFAESPGTSSFSRDGSRIAMVWKEGAKVCDTASGEAFFSVKTDALWTFSGFAFSPDNKFLATSSFDQTVKILEGTTGRTLHEFDWARDMVHCVAVNPAGTRIASGSRDGTIRLCDVETGQKLIVIDAGTEVYSLCFSRDGRYMVSGEKNGDIRVWDAPPSGSR